MGHIQIRNVPDEVHRTLKARAAKEGKSLSEFLLAELKELAAAPTLDELRERTRSLPRVGEDFDAAEVIHQERELRERELSDRR